MTARPTTDYDVAVMRYIKQRTEDNHWRRTTVAELSGIPYQTFRKWWDNEMAISVSDFAKILKAFGDNPTKALKDIAVIEKSIKENPEDK